MNYYQDDRAILIKGDIRQEAKNLPSLDMIMTSPPYYSLRKYHADDLIWDGQIDCQHEWGEKLSRNTGTLGNNLDTLAGTQTAGVAKEANQLGQFCSLCGAWRGQLGLEPSPDDRTIEVEIMELRDDLSDSEKQEIRDYFGLII